MRLPRRTCKTAPAVLQGYGVPRGESPGRFACGLLRVPHAKYHYGRYQPDPFPDLPDDRKGIVFVDIKLHNLNSRPAMQFTINPAHPPLETAEGWRRPEPLQVQAIRE